MPEPRNAEQFVLIDVAPAAEGSVRARSAVGKTFRCYDQDQPMLLAPDVRDWLPGDDQARWVDDLVEHGLDLRSSVTITPRLGGRRMICG